MTADLRKQMGEAAVKLARAGGYTNAGTVEFLVDGGRNFYFLEMNTRLQVEHPVTEMVTATDLVKLQIQIAAGERLPFAQENVALSGHAIECRIYAEDPDNNFFPSPGKIRERRVPGGPGIRLDDGVYAGWTVPNDYDPMLGKLIAWGSDRAQAIARMQRALDEYYATGIKTNVSLFRRILTTPGFRSGDIYTRWLDDYLRGAHKSDAAEQGTDSRRAESAALFAAALWNAGKGKSDANSPVSHESEPSRWKAEGRREQVDREPSR
jgi:acetyl-CoA carboxylase biotin carboxylase subunit